MVFAIGSELIFLTPLSRHPSVHVESKPGQRHSGHELGRRRVYRISFDSVGLPESIGDFFRLASSILSGVDEKTCDLCDVINDVTLG